MSEGQPWRQRQDFPDAQVRDAADPFEAARKILAGKPPGSGVLLPLMNSSAVAIELYLKCLAAELIYTPDDVMPDISVVTAKPLLKGHALASLFDRIAETDCQRLEQSFSNEHPNAGASFRELLGKCEGVFADSRYPFELGADVSKCPLNVLMACSAFLSRYVDGLVPEIRIQWE